MKNFYLSELEEMDTIELKDIIDQLTDFPNHPSYEDDATDDQLIRLVMYLQTAIANGEDVKVIDDDDDDEYDDDCDDDNDDDDYDDDDDDECDCDGCNGCNTEESTTGGISSAVVTVATAINTETEEADITVYVQCGANSGNYALVGKSIKNAMVFIGEVMNIGELRYPMVNGVEVSQDYILKNGDSLEFIKMAGEKGLA